LFFVLFVFFFFIFLLFFLFLFNNTITKRKRTKGQTMQ
jgi:hypothetical protein